MKTLKLILTKENTIYPDPSDDDGVDLYCRLTRKSSVITAISIQEFNGDLKQVLINYGIKYTIYRKGEEKVTDAIIEAIRLLEKVCCECDSAYQLRDKAINILKKAIP